MSVVGVPVAFVRGCEQQDERARLRGLVGCAEGGLAVLAVEAVADHELLRGRDVAVVDPRAGRVVALDGRRADQRLPDAARPRAGRRRSAKRRQRPSPTKVTGRDREAIAGWLPARRRRTVVVVCPESRPCVPRRHGQGRRRRLRRKGSRRSVCVFGEARSEGLEPPTF